MSNYQELFAGRKTRARFEEIKDRLECKHCDHPALIWLPSESERHAPGGKIVCNECGCFMDWLSIEKNEKKRRPQNITLMKSGRNMGIDVRSAESTGRTLNDSR